MAYRIKTVASLTGIPRATIVAWERRYNLLEPRRSPSGYRIYADDDIELLRRLKKLTEDGLAISEALEVVGRPSAAATLRRSEMIGDAPEGLSGAAEELYAALVSFDRAAADRIVPRLPQSFERAIEDVYMPVLREVGDAWERGDITVAQEHFASAFCREMLFQMFHSLGSGPETGYAVTCAGPPGEQHEIGLLAIAIRLALRGMRVTWLGTEMPFEDLCAFLARHPPRLLCLTVMHRAHAPEVSAYARQVRACAHPDTLIAVGGPGAHGLEDVGTDTLWFCPRMDDLLQRLAAVRT
jgi:DNA-binding transcriptional MerR regulator